MWIFLRRPRGNFHLQLFLRTKKKKKKVFIFTVASNPNRYCKTKDDLLRTLTKRFLSLKPNQSISTEHKHSVVTEKIKTESKEMKHFNMEIVDIQFKLIWGSAEMYHGNIHSGDWVVLHRWNGEGWCWRTPQTCNCTNCTRAKSIRAIKEVSTISFCCGKVHLSDKQL